MSLPSRSCCEGASPGNDSGSTTASTSRTGSRSLISDALPCLQNAFVFGAAVPYTSSRRGFQAALVLDDHRAALDVVRLAQMRGDFAERLGVASLELCT